MPWMRRWRVGSGLMGEQGAESIHAHLMRLERTYQGIPNELDRLKYIFKEQALESAPSLTCLRPPPKKKEEGYRRYSYILVSSMLVLTLSYFF